MNLTRAHELNAQPRTTDIIIKENVTFYEMGLSQCILNGLTACGFEKPSPIQLKAIPLGRCGFDLLIQAKSGTGKTAVFGIIALEMINSNNLTHQVFILAPTREIAVQISNVFSSIGSEMQSLKVDYFVGGTSMQSDKTKISDCHIIVSTPGRLKHMIDQNFIKIDNVRLFVLDEADKLMDDSFRKDVNYIFSKLPANKQVILSSATYPDNITSFTTKYMRMPLVISPDERSPILLGLRQFVVIVPDHPNRMKRVEVKIKELFKIFGNFKFKQSLVFFNYQSRAQSVCNNLTSKGFQATYITGNLDMKKRLSTMENLKNFKCRILCSTDLTARGIDAENVNLVINFDVPCDSATYFHRIGRAGRYGAYGIAISLVSIGELNTFKDLFASLSVPSTAVYKLPGDYLLKDIWTGNIEQFELFITYGRNNDFNDQVNSENSDENSETNLENLENNVKLHKTRNLSEKIEWMTMEDLTGWIYKNNKSDVLKKKSKKAIEIPNNFKLENVSRVQVPTDEENNRLVSYIDYDIRIRKEEMSLVYEVQKSIDFVESNLLSRLFAIEFGYVDSNYANLVNCYKVFSSRFENEHDLKNDKNVLINCLQYELEFFNQLEKIYLHGKGSTARQVISKEYWTHLKTFLTIVNKILLVRPNNKQEKSKNTNSEELENLYRNLKMKLRLFFFSLGEIEDSVFDSSISEIDVINFSESLNSFVSVNYSELLILKKYIISFAYNEEMMLNKLLELKQKSRSLSTKISEYIQLFEEIHEEKLSQIDNLNTVCINFPLTVDCIDQYNEEINNTYYKSHITKNVTQNIDEFFQQLSIQSKQIEIEMYRLLMSQND